MAFGSMFPVINRPAGGKALVPAFIPDLLQTPKPAKQVGGRMPAVHRQPGIPEPKTFMPAERGYGLFPPVRYRQAM